MPATTAQHVPATTATCAGNSGTTCADNNDNGGTTCAGNNSNSGTTCASNNGNNGHHTAPGRHLVRSSIQRGDDATGSVPTQGDNNGSYDHDIDRHNNLYDHDNSGHHTVGKGPCGILYPTRQRRDRLGPDPLGASEHTDASANACRFSVAEIF